MSDSATPSPPAGDSSKHEWERGWEGHELAQLRRLAKLSLPEKVQWLEDAHKMVMRMQAGRRNGSADPAKPLKT
jgi:hypothetical protein